VIKFIKEYPYSFLTLSLILFLFFINTTAGNRLSSFGEIMCGAFFDFRYAEKICRD
jgi:hypothetical protein